MNACLKNPFTFYGLQMQSLVPPAPPFFHHTDFFNLFWFVHLEGQFIYPNTIL